MPFLKLAQDGTVEPLLLNVAHIASVHVSGEKLTTLIMPNGARYHVNHPFNEIEQALAASGPTIREIKPTYLGTGVPQAVHDALRAVQEHYPEVVQVFYGIDGCWRYMDKNAEAPIFWDRVDVRILEAAANAVPYLPFAASLPCPSSN